MTRRKIWRGLALAATLLAAVLLLIWHRGCLVDYRRETHSLSARAPVAAFTAAPDAAIEPVLDREYLERLCRDLSTAKRRIDVAMFVVGDFRRSDSAVKRILDELKRAAERGVVVSVVMDAKKDDTESASDERCNQGAYDFLIAAGCRASWAAVPSLHAKVVAIDDRVAYVGAHNWTDAALSVNHELSFRIEGEDAARIRDWIAAIPVSSS